MNSPPNSLREEQLRDLLVKSARGPPSDQEPPEKRLKLGGPPSPATSGPAVMSPPGSTDTAITVGSHNGDEYDTESLTDSVREHMYENRLRYHAYRAGRYAFPNDAIEQDRDEMKHIISIELKAPKSWIWIIVANTCRHVMNAFFCKNHHNVVHDASAMKRTTPESCDVITEPFVYILGYAVNRSELTPFFTGTGPGHWPIELADMHPNSTFLGIDLSPIQPSEVPPNCHFMVDDIEHENGWDLDEEYFDFIHLRHTLHSIRDRNDLMQRAYRHLKPGGWFEIQELEFFPLCDDQSCPDGDGYGFRVFTQYLDAGLRVLGSEMHGIRAAADEMRAAGFENVEEDRRKCPIGDWPARPELRECGILMRETILEGLKGLATRPFRALGWTEIQIEMFLLDSMEENRSTRRSHDEATSTHEITNHRIPIKAMVQPAGWHHYHYHHHQNNGTASVWRSLGGLWGLRTAGGSFGFGMSLSHFGYSGRWGSFLLAFYFEEVMRLLRPWRPRWLYQLLIGLVYLTVSSRHIGVVRTKGFVQRAIPRSRRILRRWYVYNAHGKYTAKPLIPEGSLLVFYASIPP
ncbi:methyltransferase domain-containing protein [Colletotrichum lupini]|uniref:Methyltransferase domain-containing protein n=1 Tax=Colletotrichum lupini TaxID=145971 RepID=A0A9Q8WPD4_9PEZI|nr:methyltransferase domain-containing protein [Colletotrichum lupini]UQC91088.1 methyltransferase domain-containing protein [Colletotrichum lupini]